MIKKILFFTVALFLSESGVTLAVTYSFSPNTLIQSSQMNQNFLDVQSVVNALTATNISSGAVTAAKLNADVVRSGYGLVQHTDGSLYLDLAGTNCCLELSSSHPRVQVDGATIARGASGLLISLTSEAQGDIMYRNASGWVRLAAGTSGYFLQTQGAGANPQWAALSGAGVLGSFKNLAGVWATNSTVTYTADELVLEDASNNKVIIRTFNKTADITASGAGGLDTGAEAGNTIYYVWAIRKSSDGTQNILLSLSTSAPTMPSGYDQKALIGCVGNNNSSNFIKFHQTGKRYTFDVWATMASGSTAAWTAIDLTPANLSTNAGFVPPNLSNYCFGAYTGAGAAGAMTNDSTITADTTSVTANKLRTTGATELVRWEFDVLTADTLYWGSADANAKVYLHGFEINKLSY